MVPSKKRNTVINWYNTISYSSSRIKAEKYYGKLEDMNENEFNKQLDILVNPYKMQAKLLIVQLFNIVFIKYSVRDFMFFRYFY